MLAKWNVIDLWSIKRKPKKIPTKLDGLVSKLLRKLKRIPTKLYGLVSKPLRCPKLSSEKLGKLNHIRQLPCTIS